MNTQPEGKTAEEKKRAEKIFKLVVNEPDPEVQAWLRTVSGSDYDLVSTAYKEIRYSGGTKAKALLHKVMQAYADQQVKAEREKVLDEVLLDFIKWSYRADPDYAGRILDKYKKHLASLKLK